MQKSTSSSSSASALSKARAMLGGLTNDYSLDRIDRDLLVRADAEAKNDTELSSLLKTLQFTLNNKKGPDDVISSSQAFEVYGEIKAYRHLKHHGFLPECVATVQNQSRPDFKCTTSEGKVFYVEVKSFDIVEGEFAQSAILNDGLEAAISIEKQQHQGVRVAISEQVLAPYGKKTYQGSQVKGVIETIESKVSGNFKAKQFALGPTFAVAVIDKLIIPGRQCALSPYYHSNIFEGSACLSGTLWAAAYAQNGYLLLDHFEFEGKPTVSGTWDRHGFFSKDGSHPAQALIMFDQSLSNQLVYGLRNDYAYNHPDWSEEETESVLHQLCDAWNSQSNDHGFNLACYDSRIEFPINSPNKSAWDC